MYGCPNCGAGLRYDIPTKKLTCDYCNSFFDPYEYTREKDAVEQDLFETTVFTCPQCGGEVISADDTAAGFCSFCGASTILDSRIRGSKRPAYIIPFRLDKDECKKAYAKFMRRAFFAPSEFRDEAFLVKFRGIYIPYWVYRLSYSGEARFRGKKTERRGDFEYTYNYDLSADVEIEYRGISYDASSSFNDHISETIAPYKAVHMKPFTPSFLCGFYADTADVSQDLYSEDACAFGNKQVLSVMKEQNEFRSLELSLPNGREAQNKALAMSDACAENALFPVWFLTWRKNDRIAYFIMNGESGRICADVPIDLRKFLAGSGILALVLYVILNLFLSLRAETGLVVVMLISAVCFLLCAREESSRKKRETREGDRGYLSVNKGALKKTPAKDGKKDKGGNKTKAEKAFTVILWIIGGIAAMIGFANYSLNGLMMSTILMAAAAAVICIAALGMIPGEQKKTVIRQCLYLPVQLLVCAGIIFSLPVRDLWYYIPSVVLLVTACFTLFYMIRQFNLLSTRPLPHYVRKGGDDHA